MRTDSILDDFLPTVLSMPKRHNGLAGRPLWGISMVGKTDDNGNLTFSVDVPGIPPDSIKVEVRDGILSIRGEHKERKIHKSFTVDDRWATDAIEAKYEYGTLYLTLGESPKVKPKTIPVKT